MGRPRSTRGHPAAHDAIVAAESLSSPKSHNGPATLPQVLGAHVWGSWLGVVDADHSNYSLSLGDPSTSDSTLSFITILVDGPSHQTQYPLHHPY